jgi:hypothetical protein
VPQKNQNGEDHQILDLHCVEFLFGARLNLCDLFCHEWMAILGRAVENAWIDNHVAGLVNGFEILTVSKTLGEWACVDLKYTIPQSHLNLLHILNVSRAF